MDRTIVSLIGIVDSLDHMLTAKVPEGQDTATIAFAKERLQSLRQDLLAEGLHRAEIIGGAVDTIDEIVVKMQGFYLGKRPLQWALTGLQYIEIQDVEVPPPPIPSYESGPQEVGPLGIKEADVMARAEVRAATAAAAKASTAAASMRRLQRMAHDQLQRDGNEPKPA